LFCGHPEEIVGLQSEWGGSMPLEIPFGSAQGRLSSRWRKRGPSG